MAKKAVKMKTPVAKKAAKPAAKSAPKGKSKMKSIDDVLKLRKEKYGI